MQRTVTNIFFINPLIIAILLFSSTNATARVLLIPFAVIPQSEKAIARQIHHTIAFTLIHQSSIAVTQSDTSFSSEEMITAQFAQIIGQMAQDRSCSHAIYGSVNMFGKSLAVNAVLLRSSDFKILHSSSQTLQKIDQIPGWLNQWLSTLIPPKKQSQEKPIIENIHMEIIGMDIVDINQDSVNEILLYGTHQIQVVDKDFNVLAAKKSSASRTIVYARCFDHTSNHSCLLISETSGSDIVTSLYQWQHNQWHLLQSYPGWFIKPLHKNNILIAQKRRYSDYWRDIMQMHGPLDELVPKDYPMPVSANVFQFEFVQTNNQSFFVAYDQNERLCLYHNNDLYWRSSKPLGGSIHYIDVQSNTSDIDASTRKYIPPPLLVRDLDNNQSDELIICENQSMSGKIFENSQWFSQGVVHVMHWTGSEMQVKWTSKKQPGPVTAYAIERNGHHWRLWIACILKQQHLFRKGLSRIVVYDLL
ncbi:MAG: FG-GAP repeat protein [Candidatus Magnetoglobus multicellularis str. Araruama]|uniref:FG-GAP repeat protein n=1 Tax=Candidatus Magnetoglobus multicellularis str. Araruama TaxID=890399 RepID=A0A1V1P6K5_9BACT|nr:MAG: FG-GAP repeat protein [Candidatus Magnetoglobus multicellularis str. Araruama]